MSTLRQRAFEAVIQGTLEDVRRVLAEGANPSWCRGTKSLLVRALEHTDPAEATARSILLLEAGANWRGSSIYCPVQTIIFRELWGVLPALAKHPGALTDPYDHHSRNAAGEAAFQQKTEGLKQLAALGVDIRWGEAPRQGQAQVWKSTLEIWVENCPAVRFQNAKTPDWQETFSWLLTFSFDAKDHERVCRKVWERTARFVYRLGTKRQQWLEDTLLATPGWWHEEDGRLMLYEHFRRMADATKAKEQEAIWAKVVGLVEKTNLSLGPGKEGDHFIYPAVEMILKVCAQHKKQPRLLKNNIRRLDWALNHGASIEDGYQGFPAWARAFCSSNPPPWAAMQPLLDRGLDPLRPLPTSKTPDPLTGEAVTERILPAHYFIAYYPAGMREFVAGNPQTVHTQDEEGQNPLLFLSCLDFQYSTEPVKTILPQILFLLEQGADETLTWEGGQNFLHLLLGNRTRTCVKDLEKVISWAYTQTPALIYQKNDAGVSPWDVISTELLRFPAVERIVRHHQLGESLPAAVAGKKERF